MAVKFTRTNFTDSQKAEIFARDRATCCFSGKSLWILDYQLTPLYDIDWVDHIIPSARGGQSEVANGVCASSFFNSKKRDNSADNTYFFEDGKPTSSYFYFFGALSPQLAQQLSRFSKLDASDWYFNRCLFNVMLGLQYIAEKERFNLTRKRSDIYWFKSAWRRLSSYLKLSTGKNVPSFEDRNLILAPDNEATQSLLSLRKVGLESAFVKTAYSLYPMFFVNYDHSESFWEAKTLPAMRSVLCSAERKKCSPLLLQALQSHYQVELAG